MPARPAVGSGDGICVVLTRSDDVCYREKFVLTLGKVLKIGRSPTCQVSLATVPGVSVFHAEIRLAPPEVAAPQTMAPVTPLRVRDLSTNGTGLQISGGKKEFLKKGSDTPLPDGATLVFPMNTKKRAGDESKPDTSRIWITVAIDKGGNQPPRSAEGVVEFKFLPTLPQNEVERALLPPLPKKEVQSAFLPPVPDPLLPSRLAASGDPPNSEVTQEGSVPTTKKRDKARRKKAKGDIREVAAIVAMAHDAPIGQAMLGKLSDEVSAPRKKRRKKRNLESCDEPDQLSAPAKVQKVANVSRSDSARRKSIKSASRTRSGSRSRSSGSNSKSSSGSGSSISSRGRARRKRRRGRSRSRKRRRAGKKVGRSRSRRRSRSHGKKGSDGPTTPVPPWGTIPHGGAWPGWNPWGMWSGHQPMFRSPAESPSSSFETLKLQIFMMYQRFNPIKLPQLDSILDKYKGIEDKLLQALCSKYLGDGDASSSKKENGRD